MTTVRNFLGILGHRAGSSEEVGTENGHLNCRKLSNGRKGLDKVCLR